MNEQDIGQDRKGSALERLLADEAELNEQLLYEVLAQYVRIGKGTGTPIFTPGYAELSNQG